MESGSQETNLKTMNDVFFLDLGGNIFVTTPDIHAHQSRDSSRERRRLRKPEKLHKSVQGGAAHIQKR